MNTWVLCLSRRKALLCTIRSRSRWNGVRWSESGSGSRRRAGYERVAAGASSRSSRAAMRSAKGVVVGDPALTPRLCQSGEGTPSTPAGVCMRTTSPARERTRQAAVIGTVSPGLIFALSPSRSWSWSGTLRW